MPPVAVGRGLFGAKPGPFDLAFVLTVEILGKFQFWSRPIAYPCLSYSILLIPAKLPEVDFRPYLTDPP